MESRHCGQDKGIFFCPVHNASTPCSLQAFGIRCMLYLQNFFCSLAFLQGRTGKYDNQHVITIIITVNHCHRHYCYYLYCINLTAYKFKKVM